MSTESSTHDAWTWNGYGLVLLVVLMPAFTQALLSDHGSLMTAAADSDGLTLAPAAMVAAVCLYTAWRVNPATFPAWMVAAAALLGIKAVSRAGMQLADPVRSAEQHAWMVFLDLAQLVVTVGFVLLNGQRAFRRSPAAWGVAAGLTLGLLRVLAVRRLPQVDPGATVRVTEIVLLVGLSALVARSVMRERSVPWRIRGRLVVAVLLIAAGRTTEDADGAVHQLLPSLLGLLLIAAGAVALISAGLRILRATLAEQNRRATALRQKLELAEEEDRLHRARLHEIESTMAGIVSASELLREPTRFTAERRRQLEEMIHVELRRLERLLRKRNLVAPSVDVPAARPSGDVAPEPCAPQTTVDLDSTIENLAIAHAAKGTTVEWRPSGQRVSAQPDDVAEVLNILLDNAARHGDSAASVQVREGPHAVEILVSDRGPGVAPEVRERLFQWGARGPSSPGQGIGLHIAQTLVSKQGGYLQLCDPEPATGPVTDGVGATFVVGLPLPEGGDGVLA